MKEYALKFYYAALICVYFIYIPVSLLKIDYPILIIDFFLWCSFFALILSRKNKKYFGSSLLIYSLVLLFISSLIFRFSYDLIEYPFNVQSFIIFRNMLFGMLVLFVSTSVIDCQENLNKALKIILLGSFLNAIWGLRQLIFGFFNFELDRLAMMGSSLNEMTSLNRFRITSSFGDPLANSFFMMIGIYVFFLAKKRNILPLITQKLFPYSFLIILLALIFTLTRAPLLGLFVGLCFYGILTVKFTKRLIKKIVFYLLVFSFFIYSLDQLVVSKILLESDNQILVAIHNGLSSFWTLLQIATSQNLDQELYFLVNQSKDARSEALINGMFFCLNNPFGTGYSKEYYFPFSLNDVGLLKIAIQSGLIPFVIYVLLFVSVCFKGISNVSNSIVKGGDKSNYFYVSLWISIVLVGGISSVFDSSVMSVLIWTVAGVNLNIDKFNRI